jgi:predicted Ser/Thr protein kinase/2-polyprenyl-3-methyl-5-hydroxy-6-metoxy-1,4-benzoquinol methylase
MVGDAGTLAAALRGSDTPGRLHFVNDSGCMVKVVAAALDPTAHLRLNEPRREAEILRQLSGVRGIPQVAFVEDAAEWQAIGTAHVPGVNLSEYDVTLSELVRVAWQLSRLVIVMSWRGISHNDIKLENVLVSVNAREVWLVDFDQATTCHPRWRAFVRNTIGSAFFRDETIAHGSLRTLLRSIIGKRRLKRYRRMPPEHDARNAKQKKLYHAWQLAKLSDANAPGDHVAYYALEVDGLKLPGERPWEERWQVLREVTSFQGKRVLELGCNLGLLSVYVRKYGLAAEAWGVDCDPAILRSAALVGEAFESDVRWSQVDLATDVDAVDELIRWRSDVITCLNVWNWVPDRSLLARLLVSAPEVIFEGHQATKVEERRLRSLGFEQVRLIAATERGRPLLHATKRCARLAA